MLSGTQVASLFGVLSLDDKDFQRGLNDADKGMSSVSDRLGDLGSSMKTFGGNMTVLGAPFLAFGIAAVKSFSDSENALAQLDAVLKSTSAHNGEWSTSTKASTDDLEKLNGKLGDANDKLSRMQEIYDSNEKHTVAQTRALEDQKQAVAELSAALADGNTQLSTMTNVTHMSRDALVGLATSLQKVTVFSDETVLSAESMLLTFTNIGANIFPDATKAVLDMSQALGQDTKSSALQLGKALNDPIDGITALSRVGVKFTDSTKAMIKQLVQAGKTEEAQKIILQELQTEFGGSAVAAGKTFAGQLAITKNKLDDMMETIGQRLLPIVQRFIDGVSGLVDWFTKLDPHIQDVIVGIGALLASFAIIGPIIAVVGTAIGAIGGILAGVGAVIGVILSPIGLLIAAGAAIVYLFKDQIGGAISVFMGYMEKGEGLFKSVAAGIMALFGSNEVTQGIALFLVQVQDFFDHFQDRVKLYLSLFELYLNYYLINRLRDLWATVQPALQNLVNWFVSDGIPWIQQALLFLWNNVLTPVIDVIKGIWAVVQPELQKFADWFISGGLQNIAKGLTDFKTNAIDPFIKLITYIWDQAKPGLELLKLGFQAAFDWIKTNVIQPVIDLINSVARQLQEISGQRVQNVIGRNDSTDVGSRSGFGVSGSPNSPYVNSGGVVNGGFGNGIVPIPPVGGGSAAARAGGGSVYGGMPYLVGEQGPELFTPNVGGNISTASQTAGMMGNNTFNIYANDRAGGEAAAEGFMSKARSMGYSFG